MFASENYSASKVYTFSFACGSKEPSGHVPQILAYLPVLSKLIGTATVVG